MSNITDSKLAEAKILDESYQRVRRIQDGLSNLASGLGTARDKSTFNTWNHEGRNYDHVTLAARFREDWISQKICKVPPQDMTREWRKFKSKEAQAADSAFDMAKLYRDGYQWARLYGTSFLVMDIDDGRDVSKPINWRKLKPGCLRSMHVVDRTRITVIGDIDQEPMSPTFGMPTHYQFVTSPAPIHKERLVRFEGTELPIYERQRNLWYSDSTLIPLMDQIDNFHTASFAAAQMVNEANTDIIKVAGLANILSTDVGTQQMLNRFTEWKNIKSVFGASILDSTEEYEQKSIQLSGVKDLIWEYLKIVAAAVGIPATRFLSASPDGMNATGESDLINYVEFLQGLQKDVFVPRLKVVDRLLAANFGLDESEFEYEWNCIFPESASQKQTRFKDTSEYLKNLVDSGICSALSALEEAISEGLLKEGATVGTPLKPSTGAK